MRTYCCDWKSSYQVQRRFRPALIAVLQLSCMCCSTSSAHGCSPVRYHSLGCLLL
jgi:hypothetical protein